MQGGYAENRRGTTRMAGDAIAVDAATQGFGIRRSLLIGSGLMLVVMMTKVLCSRPGLVLAIAGRH